MLRANHTLYVSKALRKAIIERSCLKNIHFKKQDFKNHSLRGYQKQKNYCSGLYKKERKKLFNKLNLKFVSDNKLFWYTVKPLFSGKGCYNVYIKLTDKDEVIQNDKRVAETLNSFFENAVSSLKLNEKSFVIDKKHKNIQDPIEKIIIKYQLHSSILIIKNKIKYTNNFRFKHVMLSDIKNEIKGLNSNKEATHNNMPPKILRQSAEVTTNTLQLIFNSAISNSEFPEKLKLADVTPVFKNMDPLDKTDYRPVSVLPPVSKVFKKLMQKQINEHMKNKLSPYLCGYRKGFSTQYALLSLIERWEKKP